jgi:hypothetical protein
MTIFYAVAGVVAFGIVILSIMKSKTKETPQSPEESKPQLQKEEEETPTEPMYSNMVLVIYAAHKENAKPDETFPNLIITEYDAEENFFGMDAPPYIMPYTNTDIVEELNGFAAKPHASDEIKSIVEKITTWTKKMYDDDNYSYFLCELEPPELAGRAFKKKKKKS